MRPEYTITILSVNKKPGEATPTRLRRTRPAKKIMMIIFWDEYGILLKECLLRGTTISNPYYTSIIERLHCAILEKRGGKVSNGMLLLHNNAPVHKCKFVQTGFVELSHPAYSPDNALSDYYLFSNLN